MQHTGNKPRGSHIVLCEQSEQTWNADLSSKHSLLNTTLGSASAEVAQKELLWRCQRENPPLRRSPTWKDGKTIPDNGRNDGNTPASDCVYIHPEADEYLARH